MTRRPTPRHETPYMTVIEDRYPAEKAHTKRGFAHSALSQRVSTRYVGDTYGAYLVSDAALFEWRDGDWRLLWQGKRGDPIDRAAPPWKAAELPAPRMKVYLAGPMTGLPRWNFDAFAAAAAELRAAGYDVTSPHEFDLDDGFDPDAPVEGFTQDDLHAAMRRDVQAVLGVDAVVLLPGWHDSTGARLEASVASAIGTPTYLLDRFLERSTP